MVPEPIPEGMRFPQADWDRLCPESRRYLINLFETHRELERRALQPPRRKTLPDSRSNPGQQSPTAEDRRPDRR